MNEYTIKEISELTSINESTIRFWDNLNLIPNVIRVSKRRRFNEAHIKCLKKIKFLKDCGFSLEEIIFLYKQDTFESDQSQEKIISRLELLLEEKSKIETQIQNISKLKNKV